MFWWIMCREFLVVSLNTAYNASRYSLVLDEIDGGLVAVLDNRLMPRNRMHGITPQDAVQGSQ